MGNKSHPLSLSLPPPFAERSRVQRGKGGGPASAPTAAGAAEEEEAAAKVCLSPGPSGLPGREGRRGRAAAAAAAAVVRGKDAAEDEDEEALPPCGRRLPARGG